MSTQPQEGWVPSDQQFAARLALVRNRMGWNAKEAALACGLPAQSWRNWESGKRPHDYENVCKVIAERTGADVVWLSLGRAGSGPSREVSAYFTGDSSLIAA